MNRAKNAPYGECDPPHVFPLPSHSRPTGEAACLAPLKKSEKKMSWSIYPKPWSIYPKAWGRQTKHLFFPANFERSKCVRICHKNNAVR